jgi:hypothetical protein
MIIDMEPEPSSRAVTAGYRIASVLFAIALGFGVIWLLAITLNIVQGGGTVQVPLQLSPEDVGPLPEGVHVAGWPDMTVELTDATRKQTLLQGALAVGPWLLILAGLWLLRGFLRSVLDGDPFGARNVQRLRNLGVLLAAGAPLVALVESALRNALFDEIPPHPSLELGSEGFTLPLGAMLAGLGAFILAEVFAYAQRLREDVEATV